MGRGEGEERRRTEHGVHVNSVHRVMINGSSSVYVKSGTRVLTRGLGSLRPMCL